MKKFNFKFVVDTREQKPYKFREDDVRKKLDTGDYSIEGMENEVVVERKSLSDFINSVLPGRGWKRFQKELQRMQEIDRTCIVIEGDWSNICSGNYRSELHPNSLQGFVIRILVDYGIPIFFVSNHKDGNMFTYKWLWRIASVYSPMWERTKDFSDRLLEPILSGENNGELNN